MLSPGETSGVERLNSTGRLIQTNEIALQRLKPILVNDPIENGPRLEGRRQGVNRENEKLCARSLSGIRGHKLDLAEVH